MQFNQIFGIAMGVLPKDTALLRRFTGRTLTPEGLYVNAYSEAQPIVASIQPIDRSRYGHMGLDVAKGYIAVYTQTPLDDVNTDKNPDFLIWQGRAWEVVNRANWTQTGNFNGVVCMDKGSCETFTGLDDA